jgi:hypothetical protein
LFNIETHKPVCGKKELKKYLNAQLEILKLFFKENKEFYNYYRSDCVFSDHLYFTRNDFDTSQNVSSINYLIDKRFYTQHSYLIAKIISNDLISDYIESSLIFIKNAVDYKTNNSKPASNEQRIVWTGSQISFVELMYALHEDKAINNGDLTLTQFMETMGLKFNINPGHFNGSIYEMKSRSRQAKYMVSLTSKFVKRLNRDDE